VEWSASFVALKYNVRRITGWFLRKTIPGTIYLVAGVYNRKNNGQNLCDVPLSYLIKRRTTRTQHQKARVPLLFLIKQGIVCKQTAHKPSRAIFAADKTVC
jgi:hypothetical protein